MRVEDAIRNLGAGLRNVLARQVIIEKQLNRMQRSDGDGFWIVLSSYTVLSPVAATPSSIGLQTIPRDCTLLKWAHSVFVATTNNGTNYWTVSLQISVAAVNTTIASFTTAADSVGTWNRHVATSFTTSVLTANSHLYLHVTAAKTGTPGNLSWAGGAAFII